MKKRWIAVVAVLALSGSLLAGCSSSDTAEETEGEEAAEEEETGELETITVAASPTPHAEILYHVQDALIEEGYDLQVTEFEDYVQPNEVVESEEFDANYFQHTPYLDDYNEENGTHLVSVGGVHYEPMGIYPGTKDSLDDLEEGDVIAVPDDTTNEARALELLEANGVITLKEGVGLEATALDVVDNPYNIELLELEAAQVPRHIDEVAFAVANGNYALSAGITDREGAIYEDTESDYLSTYYNIVAVKEGHENDAKILALMDALRSEETQQWIEEEYQGSVIPYNE